MKRTTLTLAALAVMGLFPCERVSAGFVTATLTATPDPILEGGSTNLTLSIQDTPYSYDGYHTGYGYISAFSGSFIPGDNQSSVPATGSGSGLFASASQSFTYSTAGDYTARFTGTVTTQDQYSYSYYEYYPVYRYDFWGNGYVQYVPVYRTGYAYAGTGTAINASTGVHVSNVGPTITKLDWAPNVLTGQTFNFSTTATDPGLAGGEQLTIAYDFSGKGLYSDFVETGATTDGGTYHYDQAGLYHVNVLVTDSHGASTMGSFDVNVQNPDMVTPTPSSLAYVGGAAATFAGFFGWRRRKRAVAA
jgi:hypothetical protein